MLKFENKKVLFIGAHPDDIEICCGGTIFKLKENNEIHVRVFSPCVQSVPKGMGVYAIADDFKRAMDYLNPKTNFLYDFPVRRFSEHRQNILEKLIDIRNKIKPDVVFCIAKDDGHQDHNVIGEETIRAFNNQASIITYSLPKNSNKSEFNMVVELTEDEVEVKNNILKCYITQQHRPYFKEGVFKTTLEYNGLITNKKYSELFNIYKLFI